MSVSNEISCIGFHVGILVVTPCASLAIVGIICSSELLCEFLNISLNCLNVFVVNP